jgi:hypothetical protein
MRITRNRACMLALYTILIYSYQAVIMVITRPHRLTVRTNPSQGLNRSSILRGVTDRDLVLLNSSDSLYGKDNFGVPLSISS